MSEQPGQFDPGGRDNPGGTGEAGGAGVAGSESRRAARPVAAEEGVVLMSGSKSPLFFDQHHSGDARAQGRRAQSGGGVGVACAQNRKIRVTGARVNLANSNSRPSIEFASPVINMNVKVTLVRVSWYHFRLL
ncbi:MAG: hypothetical protein EZS28_044884 [Streblomastix strix]|uniref:Uncharacterized protein n=1 Tax=Streblomastix strix TaxID=222440 RepID=A0A5J4TP06_9EUKA|nr:MAG: hypothetical protein EZS28_044884 [Streblomastix strix]